MRLWYTIERKVLVAVGRSKPDGEAEIVDRNPYRIRPERQRTHSPSGIEGEMHAITPRIPGTCRRTTWTVFIGLFVAFLGCTISHGLDPGYTEPGGQFTITFNIGAMVGTMGGVLVRETVPEGETYVVPEATLPGLAAAFHVYWDAFEGATMTIPSGALSGDIVVNIWVSNFDLIRGGFKDLGGERIFLSLDFMVEGDEAADASKEETFLFNEGYPMEFTLPLDAQMLPLLQLAEFDLSTPLTLAYWTGSEFVIIPTTQTETELIGTVPYLSTIVGKAIQQ